MKYNIIWVYAKQMIELIICANRPVLNALIIVHVTLRECMYICSVMIATKSKQSSAWQKSWGVYT